MLLGAVKVVEYGQECLDNVARHALALNLAVGLGALAVVRVFSTQPLEVDEVLVLGFGVCNSFGIELVFQAVGLCGVEDVFDGQFVVCGLG
jgi:hypothetical protein